MNLSAEERSAINGDRWFSDLSATSRHDLLRHAVVKRHADGELISAQGAPGGAWFACASGALRISSTSASGHQTTLTYLRPGTWFGDPALFDGERAMHDVFSVGNSAVLQVKSPQLRQILAANADLCLAVLRLQAQQLRHLLLERDEIHQQSVRARLVKHLLSLGQAHGVPTHPHRGRVRIGLDLTQGQLAKLVRCSRQHVNSHLKDMERHGLIRIEREGLVICDADALSADANR